MRVGQTEATGRLLQRQETVPARAPPQREGEVCSESREGRRSSQTDSVDCAVGWGWARDRVLITGNVVGNVQSEDLGAEAGGSHRRTGDR